MYFERMVFKKITKIIFLSFYFPRVKNKILISTKPFVFYNLGKLYLGPRVVLLLGYFILRFKSYHVFRLFFSIFDYRASTIQSF